MELKWVTQFKASDNIKTEVGKTSTEPLGTKFIIKGILIDSTTNKNNWCVERDDFDFLAKDFIGKQIRVDHAEKVSEVVGKIISTEVDNPHDENKSDWDLSNPNPHIHFEAEVETSNNNIIIPMKNGYIDSISPAVDARTILCSECKKPMEPIANTFIKTCKCENEVKLLKDMTARETSLVASPAYSSTKIKVYGFAASVNDSFISEENILLVVNDELKKRNIHTS